MNDSTVSLVGKSPLIRALDQDITIAARSDAKVLITGESGVGKEVAARLIHLRSKRAHGPLLVLNCAGVPETLLESELFGHTRGSFTGAVRDKVGLFELAHGGTVFLDEIGEMSLRMQATLLRFLETGEIQRVGADRQPSRVNARVICATNRNLTERIAHGDFREDLYYRLNVIHLKIPPLRDRMEDIPLLVDYFCGAFAAQHRMPMPTMNKAVTDALFSYEWPGNVRQLKNVIERMVVRARDGEVGLADLPPELRRLTLATPDPTLPPAEALADRLARELFDRLVERHESFWTLVYDPFLARDLTRDTVRRMVGLALEQAGGGYPELFVLLNLRKKEEQKRLVAFLRKHDCVVGNPDTRPRKGPDKKPGGDGRGRSRVHVA